MHSSDEHINLKTARNRIAYPHARWSCPYLNRPTRRKGEGAPVGAARPLIDELNRYG